MSTNAERIQRARVALQAIYCRKHYRADEEQIVDLVADLLHLARAIELDPDEIAARAQMHVAHESSDRLYEFDALVQVRAPNATKAREAAESLASTVEKMDSGLVIVPEGEPEVVT